MPMPHFADQRRALVEAVEPVDLAIYATAPTGQMPLEFIVVGMPDWKPPTAAVGWYEVKWPVMVCVSRSGTNDAATATRLEELWPAVLQVLVDAVDDDHTLGDVCFDAEVIESYYSPVTISGTDYPGQIINLKMQGA